MNGLVKRSDVIETANKFSFTDENDRRRYLDFLDYCLKETKTAYDVDAVVEELGKEKTICFLTDANTGNEVSDLVYRRVYGALDKAIEIVKAGGKV